MVRPIEFPFALFALFAFVATLPIAYFYLNEYAPMLPPEARFLALFAMPMTAALFLTSWLQPG